MIREKLVVFTNKITERARQIEKDQTTTQNILKSSIGPQFKEAMETLNVKCVEAKKTRAALDKHIETRGQKKQRLEGEKEQNTNWSTPISSCRSKSIRT
jgi:hypothetical protein